MKTSKVVEWALKNYPETRNSDKALMLTVWEQQGLQLIDQQKQIFWDKCSSSESIRRTRQKFQEHGNYPATERVDNLRFEQYKQARQSIPRTESPHDMAGIHREQ